MVVLAVMITIYGNLDVNQSNEMIITVDLFPRIQNVTVTEKSPLQDKIT